MGTIGLHSTRRQILEAHTGSCFKSFLPSYNHGHCYVDDMCSVLQERAEREYTTVEAKSIFDHCWDGVTLFCIREHHPRSHEDRQLCNGKFHYLSPVYSKDNLVQLAQNCIFTTSIWSNLFSVDKQCSLRRNSE